MADSCKSINRVFSRKVINDLICYGESPIFDSAVIHYVSNPKSKTYGEIITEIYNYLGQSNRNEYYYMNTLLNKLLVGIHNVNTTTALSQVRIGNHIADFVMINGEGRVYEIKSDLDNFERLNNQLFDYFKAFSKVSVLASERERDHVERVLGKLGDLGNSVGIYVLSEDDKIFSKIRSREPKEFNALLEHKCIFTLLRKQEYENVLLSYFKSLPQVAPVFYFKECLKLFEQIPILNAQELALKELKKRNKITKNDFDIIPDTLKSVVYFAHLANKIPIIEHLLQSQYQGG